MFRLYKAELKKIFLKPSIFVVTGLIILMLAFSAFNYSPSTKDDYLATYTSVSNGKVSDYYSAFKNESSTYGMSTIKTLMTKAQAYIDYYKSNGDAVADLKEQWLSVKTIYNESSESSQSYVSLYNAWKAHVGNSDEVTYKSSLENKRN